MSDLNPTPVTAIVPVPGTDSHTVVPLADPVKAAPTFATKAAREAFYRERIATKPTWANAALMVVYANQTMGEQLQGATTDLNGIGFSGKDAVILSSFARQFATWNGQAIKRYPTPFSEKQQALVLRLMPRYVGQVLKHMEAKGTLPAVVKATAAPVVGAA